jgi:Asp-tRNA(Asn)/Glu-tRNA(Gln) amidotransferase A subunit family amidase
MRDDDLCFTPAVELARRLRARELSARELLAAYTDRIGRVNPRLNAIARSAADAALLLEGLRGDDPALPLARPGLPDDARRPPHNIRRSCATSTCWRCRPSRYCRFRWSRSG